MITYFDWAAVYNQIIDKLIIININTILISIKIISFNVIMNDVINFENYFFILTITSIGPTKKVDRQFARIIFLVVAMVLWMSWLLGLEMTLLVWPCSLCGRCQWPLCVFHRGLWRISGAGITDSGTWNGFWCVDIGSGVERVNFPDHSKPVHCETVISESLDILNTKYDAET